VVTKDVPPDTLVAGVPAKVKKHLNKQDEETAGEEAATPQAATVADAPV
jgi:acetyltransferase-like isoleucine patch superfamily enzyme